MALLLTILSVLAAWLFLAVLVTGLLLILKTLQSVRAHLEKIAWGVRAIEQQTGPLARRLDTLAASMRGAGRELDGVAGGLGAVERGLAAAAPALHPRN